MAVYIRGKCHKLILLVVMVKIFRHSQAKGNMTFKKSHFFLQHGHFLMQIWVNYCQILLKMPRTPRELLAEYFSVSPMQVTFFSGVSDLSFHSVLGKNKNYRKFQRNWERQCDDSLPFNFTFHSQILILKSKT